MIWTLCIGEMCRTFLEGFGSARKCTHEGRAWMQLDFQQFVVQLDKFISIKPVPGISTICSAAGQIYFYKTCARYFKNL